ncbi:hypothetical protein AMECASPLE_016746 [Ameca splendens]|uniref:Uncharacterized protein n=1 Tax=Ameca splendens TaxID=208324 RepID=A0ABV0XRB8_9TELE
MCIFPTVTLRCFCIFLSNDKATDSAEDRDRPDHAMFPRCSVEKHLQNNNTLGSEGKAAYRRCGMEPDSELCTLPCQAVKARLHNTTVTCLGPFSYKGVFT